MSKIALAAAALALLAGPALAQTQSTLVRTARVDFNDPAQAQQVYARLEAAAARVCTPPSDNRYVAVPDRDCMAKALADAVAKTNQPQLTQAYNSAGQSTNRALAGNDQ